jgi:8-oxo-dGTP pyrophosphatase MutT (NUDIX family)
MPMSPYVAGLRAAVGHQLLVLPSATVLPVRADGALLLLHHRDSGRWETVGGMVEPNERPEDAARREAREELGVEVELGALLTVVGGPEYEVHYPNGDDVTYVVAVWEATIVDGEPAAGDPEEVVALRWFRRDELDGADLGRGTRALLTTLGWLPDTVADHAVRG